MWPNQVERAFSSIFPLPPATDFKYWWISHSFFSFVVITTFYEFSSSLLNTTYFSSCTIITAFYEFLFSLLNTTYFSSTIITINDNSACSHSFFSRVIFNFFWYHWCWQWHHWYYGWWFAFKWALNNSVSIIFNNIPEQQQHFISFSF